MSEADSDVDSESDNSSADSFEETRLSFFPRGKPPLAELHTPGQCVILKALTTSNASDFFSLERLETIGDSFIKFAVTVHLFCRHKRIHEGKLSHLRSHQACNSNLYRLGIKKGLAERMVGAKFEPQENWIPPGYRIRFDHRENVGEDACPQQVSSPPPQGKQQRGGKLRRGGRRGGRRSGIAGHSRSDKVETSHESKCYDGDDDLAQMVPYFWQVHTLCILYF